MSAEPARRSERWKALERDAAQALGGERIVEPWTLFRERPDVIVDDLGLVIDAKAHKRFSHHRILEAVERRYCSPGQTPAIVTREPRGCAYIAVPLSWLGGILEEVRAGRARLTPIQSAAVLQSVLKEVENE